MSFVVPDYNRGELLQRRLAGGGLTFVVATVCAAGLATGLKVAYDTGVALPPIILVEPPIKPPAKPPEPIATTKPVDGPSTQAPVIDIDAPIVTVEKQGPIAINHPPVDTGTVIDNDIVTPPLSQTAAPIVIAASIDPKYRATMQPPYPSNAMRLEQEGRVVLNVHIAADGHVQEALVKTTSGFSSLDEAAQSYALKQWHLRPATRDGVAVESWLVVPVLFHINQA